MQKQGYTSSSLCDMLLRTPPVAMVLFSLLMVLWSVGWGNLTLVLLFASENLDFQHFLAAR